MENKKNEKVSKPPVVTAEDKALSAAIDRVYRKYGADLPAFFRDVYRDVGLERQEPDTIGRDRKA
jgi:hypothetical protein